jgi:hypothetical protein
MDRFEEILMSEKEEDCQRFLTTNKEILLSTFKKKVCIPKFKFGNEFVSDFVLFDYPSTLAGNITLIEIEPPTVRAFTKNGKYAKRLNDAIGQINDWFAWISENEDYFLRTLMSADKASPRLHRDSLFEFERGRAFWRNRKNVFIDAKIILGRRDFLSEEDNKRRMAVYQTTNRTIEITHFDRLLDTYHRLLDTYQKTTELKKAGDKDATSNELTTLSNSKFPEVRGLVASRKSTDQATLRYLAEDPESAVVYEVIRNEHTPYDVLHKLIYRNDGHLHKILFKRIALPEDLIPVLFERSSEYLRRLILEHPNCPEEILISASHSTDRGHRRRAAQHPKLKDEAVLSSLANDPEAFVRTGAARNPNLPNKLIVKLSYDEDKKVRIAAKYQNVNIPEDALIQRIEDEGDWAQGEVAKHPNLRRVDILKRLARHENYLVRLGVTENKHLPASIRKKLLNDPNEQVRNAARRFTKN